MHSAAAYGAAAGLPVHVVVPSDTPAIATNPRYARQESDLGVFEALAGVGLGLLDLLSG